MTGTPRRDFDDADRLIDGYLDESLSADETTRLMELLAEEDDVAVRFARAALLHDRLHDVVAGDALAVAGGSDHAAAAARHGSSRWLTVAAVLALTALFALLLRQPASTASAAGLALDRIVVAAGSAADREYRIRVLDHGPGGVPPVVMSGGRGRKPGIDGASLFVRGHDRFVLVRRFGDGSEFITGSDGTTGWAVPPGGRVHLSRDPRRFRRGVPGERQDVPFIDMRSGFEELRRGYDLSLADASPADDAAPGRRLDAVRVAGRPRGPQAVRAWIGEDGVPTRIEIDGLPPEDGMPQSIALELVSRADLGEAFFDHGSHHAADRAVDWE